MDCRYNTITELNFSEMLIILDLKGLHIFDFPAEVKFLKNLSSNFLQLVPGWWMARLTPVQRKPEYEGI